MTRVNCARSIQQAGRSILGAVHHTVTEHWLDDVSFGPSPLADEWDLLVLMDTLRPDALAEVADEYEWLPNGSAIGTRRSPASWSMAWLANACDPKQYGDVMSETALVAWNPYTETQTNEDDWFRFEEVWRDAWDDDVGCVPPDAVVQRGIQVGRETDAERLIVWLQQPHAPYRSLNAGRPATSFADRRGDDEYPRVWDYCKSGEVTREEAWGAMLDTLRWGLNHVEILLENADADRAVLSSDHGEAFGELGGLLWGHGPGLPHPSLITVPWVSVDATDTLGVETVQQPSSAGVSSEERLKALGYL